ncbi:MAG TPA: TolC family protein [Polyangiales bacterium]|nr:TolC family protein [Polyangiales bacterium]
MVAVVQAADVPKAADVARTSDASAPPDAKVNALLRDDRALATWMSDRSFEVSAAKDELTAARADYRDSQVLPNPNVDLGVSNLALGHSNPRDLPLSKMLIYGVGVSELVELGKRGPRGDAAAMRAYAAERGVATTLGERVADARLALGRLLYAKARANELDQSLTQARAAADVAKGRLDHQALSGVDYDRLLIDLGGVESDTLRAHAEADAAQTVCDTALRSRCVIDDVDVSVLSRADIAPQVPALEQRPDIAQLSYQAQAAEKDATLAGRRAVPDLTFRLGYTRDTFTVSGDQAHTLGLTVSAPIPVFDQGEHAKSAALARASSLTNQRESALARAKSSVTSLQTRQQALAAALAKIESDALPRVDAVLRAEEHGLIEGQLDITDLVLARRDAIGLRLQSLDLRFELFSTNNELRQALGLDAALLQR